MHPHLRLLLLAAGTACSNNDRECAEGLSEVERLLDVGKLHEGSVIAAKLWKEDDCRGERAAKLQHRIRVEIERRKRAETLALLNAGRERQKKEAEAQLDDFLSWVEANKTKPDFLDGDRECYEGDDPQAGYCMVAASLEMRRAEWLVRDPRRVIFSSEGLPTAVRPSCASLGAKKIRKWQWKDIGVHYHCRFPPNAPRLANMHFWVKHAPRNTFVAAFTDEYLIDPPFDFHETLKTQGVTIW